MNEIARATNDVIARQFEVAQSLLAALEQERTALAALDTEAVDAAGTDKVARLEEMEELESERRALIEVDDFDAATPDDADPDNPLGATWTRLLELLKRCRLLNESNGALVAQQRRHVQQALTLLSGGTAEGDVYGPDGMKPNPGRATTIATA